MDLNQAIGFGLLVKAAEAVAPEDITNRAGEIIHVGYGPISMDYKVVTTIYANDLATDMNPERAAKIVSIGLALQGADNSVVIAVRGTDSIWEWIHDAEFWTVPYPCLPGAGKSEDGFTAMYQSMRIGTADTSARVTAALAALPFERPPGALIICGHSLGAALATLLALDVAANTSFKKPSVYTYASPHTGDPGFVSTYNQVVTDNYRIANRVDIVPKVPFPPQYEHVAGLYDLNPMTLLPLPPHVLVKFELACEHHMTTYLHLLSLLAKGAVLPLDGACTP